MRAAPPPEDSLRAANDGPNGGGALWRLSRRDSLA
jgi:hypothetical protein